MFFFSSRLSPKTSTYSQDKYLLPRQIFTLTTNMHIANKQPKAFQLTQDTTKQKTTYKDKGQHENKYDSLTGSLHRLLMATSTLEMSACQVLDTATSHVFCGMLTDLPNGLVCEGERSTVIRSRMLLYTVHSFTAHFHLSYEINTRSIAENIWSKQCWSYR